MVNLRHINLLLSLQFQVYEVVSVHLGKVVPKLFMVHVNASIQNLVPLKVPMVLLQNLPRIPTTFRKDLFSLEVFPNGSGGEVHTSLLSAEDIVLHTLLSLNQVKVEDYQRNTILFDLAQVLA